MTRLNWGVVGQRVYEAGADRGVLYVEDSVGVAWNGLTAVNENPSGGDPAPYYIDGFKYANVAAFEEFEATLEAFSAPAEFGPCDGTVSIGNGLFITQQRRKSFGFSYRTGLGNDVIGLGFGYKLHLVYNALAAPASRANNSLSESPEPMTLSWAISTMPPRLSSHKPSAHLVIDTRMTSVSVLTELENILYGSETQFARLPSQSELFSIFA